MRIKDYLLRIARLLMAHGVILTSLNLPKIAELRDEEAIEYEAALNYNLYWAVIG